MRAGEGLCLLIDVDLVKAAIDFLVGRLPSRSGKLKHYLLCRCDWSCVAEVRSCKSDSRRRFFGCREMRSLYDVERRMRRANK